MALGMEVGPGDFVLDEDPVPLPKKGAEPPSPIFGPCLLWPNSWRDQDALGMEVGLGPGRPHCARWGPSSPPKKRGGALLPNFLFISVVVKRLDASRFHLVWR